MVGRTVGWGKVAFMWGGRGVCHMESYESMNRSVKEFGRAWRAGCRCGSAPRDVDWDGRDEGTARDHSTIFCGSPVKVASSFPGSIPPGGPTRFLLGHDAVSSDFHPDGISSVPF